MHNRWANSLFLTLTLLALSACNEHVPNNRPIIDPFATVDGGTDGGTDDGTVVRPSGVLFFKNICGCQNGASFLMMGTTCDSFCASHSSTNQALLYTTFTDTSADTNFDTVSKWCTTTITDSSGNGEIPICQLNLKSEDGQTVTVTPTGADGSDTNTLVFNTTGLLSESKVYLLQLVETTSAATSDTTQLHLAQDGEGGYPTGPLYIQPITQYTCLNRVLLVPSNQTTTTPVYYDQAFPQHYYFIEQVRPDPIPAAYKHQVVCHDDNGGTVADAAGLPRLQESPGSYALWNKDDPRFYDLDGDGTADVVNLIAKKYKAITGNTLTTTGIFFPLTMSPGPTAPSSTSGTTTPTLNNPVTMGHLMAIFQTTDTNHVAYCPKEANYNGSNGLLKAIGEVIQQDTEGIYFAKREALTYTDSTTGQPVTVQDDVLIVRESDMLVNWFYFKNNTPTKPTTVAELRSNKIVFYYPYNPDAPYIRGAGQNLYTIVLPSELGSAPSTTTTAPSTAYPAHDKRFGCIPVSQSDD